MDILHNLALGADVAFSWQGLLFCFVGVLVGTFVGVLTRRHCRKLQVGTVRLS